MDMYTTGVLNRVVRDLDPDPSAWLLNTFFPAQITEESEEIHFDIENEQPRITPFVSPLQEGRLVENLGFDTATFKPAYAKDKRVFNADAPVKRAIGEAPLGNLTAEQRTQRNLARATLDQNRMLTRREEVMASEALRLGTVTVSGEGFETKVVNYGRAAALTVTLTGTDKWSDTANSDPPDDIETWAGLIQANGGGVARNVVMATDSWAAARQNQKVKDLLDTRRGSTSRLELGPLAAEHVRYVGTLGSFDLWVYQDTYIDETGAAQQMMPSGSVIMANGAGLDGTRHYGMIKDYEANHRAQRSFQKSWVIKDPSQRILLMQSAPLVVPYRPNASLGADVLNG